jgi:hypothetical protein
MQLRGQIAVWRLFALALVTVLAGAAPARADARADACEGDLQRVMCGALPLSTYELQRCCQAYRSDEQPGDADIASVAASGTSPGSDNAATSELAALHAAVRRFDLEDGASQLQWLAFNCTAMTSATLPTFGSDGGVRLVSHAVPILTPRLVARIKAAALKRAPPEVVAAVGAANSSTATPKDLLFVNIGAHLSQFLPPSSGLLGAAELGLLRARLAAGGPVQAAALDSLRTGATAMGCTLP